MPAQSATWTYAIDETALPEGAMAPAYPSGVNLVIARVEGLVYAVSGCCAHMGCPLFTGSLAGHILTCPCHDWKFDVRTGRFLAAPEIGLAVYATKSEDGKVYVNLGQGGSPR
ncbi:MAG TPA: Rieske (2Fe-2S) protein [Burkholderiales bacterium]|nr:Rieske (2Fe-2S) protein [Burkholderiales bacterium]HUP09005.1 Rieske (2Fe-2S) protein [Caldimonas sp.]